MRDEGRTGGCSSNFSPCSGLALRFAKTPSFEEGRAPPPYTLTGAASVPGAEAGKDGNSVTARCNVGLLSSSSLAG